MKVSSASILGTEYERRLHFSETEKKALRRAADLVSQARDTAARRDPGFHDSDGDTTLAEIEYGIATVLEGLDLEF